MKAGSRSGFGVFVVCFLAFPLLAQETMPELKLNDKEYFELPGVNVMAFQDVYPEGHQGGVSIIQNGIRVATNGDIRHPFSA